MERVRLAIPDQLPPKGLWSKPETRGCSGQDHAVQTLGRREKKDQSQRGLLPGTSLLASGLTLLLDEVDQPIGGRIVRSHWAAAIKLRFNFLSQLLSQLHSARARRKNGMRKLPTLLVKSTSRLTGIPHPPL